MATRRLITDRLELVPLDLERDLVGLHKMHSDSEMFRFDPTAGPTQSPDETRARLSHELEGSQGWTWSIWMHNGAEALGTFGLFGGPPGPVRGLTWRLRRDSWGQGIMSEAARMAVEALLERSDIDGVEAWVDIENERSLSVARRARLDERGRLPRVYPDRISQTVVMARPASHQMADVLSVWPTLTVRDVRGTADLLCKVLGLHIQFTYGDPPGFCRLAYSQWSGSPGMELTLADKDPEPVAVSIDIGTSTDLVFQRAVAAGLECVSSPEDFPWMRREFVFLLPERHRFRVIGPMNPGNGGVTESA